MNKILIVGAGGFGREALECCIDVIKGTGRIISGFLDDNPNALKGCNLDVNVLGTISDYNPKLDEICVLAIGKPVLRKKVFEQLKNKGAHFMTLAHPTAYISPSADIGEGTILCPFSSVSTHAKIGVGVLLNFYANVGHDAVVGNFTVMNVHSNVNGFSELEECVFLGGHSVVLPRVKVGARAKIGAGSTAMRNVKSEMTVVGVPAQKFL